MGVPFEKKYVELDQATRDIVTSTYHNWQQVASVETGRAPSLPEYHNEPEFCYSATRDEIERKGWSLVPSKYIEFCNRDEQIDFDTKMQELQADIRELLQQEEESKKELKRLFEKLGYKL
jgi:type I restriction enzyme M protein